MGYRIPFQQQDVQIRPADAAMYDTMQGDQTAQGLNASMEQEIPVQQVPQQQYMPQQQVVTTRTEQPPEFNKYMGEYDTAAQKQVQAAKKMGDVQAKIMESDANFLDKQAEELAQSRMEQDQRRESLKKNLDDQENRINTAKSEMQAAKIDGMRLFKDNNQNRVLAVLGLALGGMGAAMTGGKNYAADMLNTIIDNDINEQKFEAEKKGTTYAQALKERDIINSTFDHEEDRYNAQKLERLQGIKLQAEGMANRIGGEKQRQQMAVTMASVEQEIAKTKAAMYQNASTRTETTTLIGGKPGATGEGKALTEAQAKANMFANAMETADKQLIPAEKYGASYTGAAAIKWSPEAMKSEEAKLYTQASSAWQEAYDRFASGAAISEPERARTIARAMPQVGDTEKVLEQKRTYRQKVQDDIRTGVIGSAQSVRETAQRYKPLSATPVNYTK